MKEQTQRKGADLWKRIFFTVIALQILIGVFFYIKMAQFGALEAQAEQPMPPVPVDFVAAQSVSWQPRIYTTGTLEASKGIDVRAELGGLVEAIHFSSGAEVEQGDLLVTLDDKTEVAALKSAKASLASAESQYNRNKKLVKSQYVSSGDIEQQRAQVDLALAQMESAKVALAKKQIKAPFSGRLGINQVDLGELVQTGGAIVNLQALDTLLLDFFVPESELGQLRQNGQVEFSVEAYPDEVFVCEIIAWEPKVDEVTRNIRVQARVENPEKRLVPGMFAEISLVTDTQQTLFELPESAVINNISGEAVYIMTLNTPETTEGDVEVDENNDQEAAQPTYSLSLRQVDVAYRQSGTVGVSTGLNENDLVVISGQNKLFPGMNVRPVAESHADLSAR